MVNIKSALFSGETPLNNLSRTKNARASGGFFIFYSQKNSNENKL